MDLLNCRKEIHLELLLRVVFLLVGYSDSLHLQLFFYLFLCLLDVNRERETSRSDQKI